jgi:hypothetical protein
MITLSDTLEFDRLFEKKLRNIPFSDQEENRYFNLISMQEEFNCSGRFIKDEKCNKWKY